MKGIYVVIPIWGEQYVRRWLDLALPSLLADGNLPALAKQHPIKTLLFTTQEDLNVILPHPAFKMLRDVGGLRVQTISQDRKGATAHHAGTLMTLCHREGLKRAWGDDHGIIPLCGDLVFANGAMTSIARHIAAGKRAMVTQGFGVIEDKFSAQVEALGLRRQGVLPIPPRTLVRMMFDTIHPAFSSKFWDAPNCTSHPCMMYWHLGERSLLMRCWHLYPVFAYPDRQVLMRGSIDDDLIGVGLSDRDGQCVALDDSDDCMFVDVFDPKKRDDLHAYQVMSHPYSVEYVTGWAERWARPLHCESVQRHKFWIHDGELDRGAWKNVEAESDRIVEEIVTAVRNLNRPTGTALL